MTAFCFGILVAAGMALTDGPPMAGPPSPCPDSPNCVSSLSRDRRHAIAPLTYSGSRQEAMETLVAVVAALPGAAVTARTADALQVAFTSKWLKFVDDVDFWLPEEEPGVIHLRSASRTGYWDLGVNRKRVETLRKLFKDRGV